MTPTIAFFIGDSIVAGMGDEQGLGWPGRLMKGVRGNGRAVVDYNLGINGDTVGLIADRWADECRRRCPPPLSAATVFSFGLNDATLEEDGSPRMERPHSVQTATAMLSEAKALGPTLWIGPTPIDETSQPRRSATGQLRTKRNTLTESYNEAYRGAAESLSIPYLDLFGPLSANPEWITQLPDGIHPNASGYDRMAGLIGGWHGWREFVESL